MGENRSVEAALRKTKGKAVLWLVFGWATAVPAGLVTIVCMLALDNSAAIAVAFFAGITALGIWAIIRGMRKYKLVKCYPDYILRLATDPADALNYLASTTGKSLEVVTREVRQMLALGFLPNFFFDVKAQKLVCVSEEAVKAVTRGVLHKPVFCKQCGALVRATPGSGQTATCEYCGTVQTLTKE